MRGYNIQGLDAVLTERLHSHLLNLQPQLYDRGESFLPTIDSVRFETDDLHTQGWGLYFISVSALNREDISQCGPLLIHINEANRGKLKGKVIDIVDRRLCVTDLMQKAKEKSEKK
jgi:hypothetical protein